MRDSSSNWLRLREPNARLGTRGWERPRWLGLFGGKRSARRN
jgi:hypothetical protein